MNGLYPVENGLSSFADAAVFTSYEQEIHEFYQLHKDGNFYSDILEKYFGGDKKKGGAGGKRWITYTPAGAPGNIIMFGVDDGLYPRYVGYDKKGNVVKMITDFIQLK
jgi:hypothetical protein